MIKKRVRQALRHVGLERVRNPSFGDFLKTNQIETVLDVGANEGQYALLLRELGYCGKIISFEPIEAVFERLAANAAKDPQWEVHNFGFGTLTQDVDIGVSDQSVFSSFKKPTSYVDDFFPGSRFVRNETVKVVRLDEFLDGHPAAGANCYLKVDTQGFEEEVLIGAGDWLERLTAIQLELPTTPLYEGQKNWLEMINLLTKAGFEVAMIKENSYDWDRVRLLEFDIVFTRDA